MPFGGFFFPCFLSEWATLSLVKVYDEFRDFPLQKTFILLYPSVLVKFLSLYAFGIQGLCVLWFDI
jgi:hypothetical protein